MKILIAGGGIGGLSLALACSHFDLDYEVFEAAPQIREIGAGIWVPPNAMKVMQRLGVSDAIVQQGWPMDMANVGASETQVWQRIDSAWLKNNFGSGNVAIHRGKLQALLYHMLDSNKVHSGKRLVNLEQLNNKVTAVFEDGSRAEGDCLIGADGIHSATRKVLFGELPLRYSGQTCWRGIVDYRLPKEMQHLMYELWGKLPGQRFAYSHINANSVYYYGTMAVEPGGKDDNATIKTTLHNYFDCFGERAASIIEAIKPETIIRTDLYDLKPITNWVQGNAALLGDAAHATTPNLGQGAAQAIEDAYILAYELSKTSTTINDALLHYQAMRIKKAHYIVNTSWMIAQMGNIKNPFLASIRDFMMRYTPDFAMRARLRKAYKTNFPDDRV